MTVRVALLPLLLAFASAAPAFAQPAGPTGSVTLMSRPDGASFRIQGDVTVVGRTPMTLNRGLAGRYRVFGSEIGYSRWSRTMEFDGMSADTVWMTLHQKSGFMAGARSLILPGWGQFYDEHPVRGVMFLIGGLAAGAGVGVAELRYRHRVDDFNAAEAAYQAAQNQADANAAFAARERAGDRAEDAYQLRRVLMGAAAAVVGISVLEAAASVPRPLGTILLGAGPGGSNPSGRGLRTGGPAVTMTLARVKF
jgi:hypothetical protein